MADVEKLLLHSKGTISLVRHATSKEIFSCGYDNSVGIWSKDEDTDELVPDVQNCANNCQGVVAIHDDDIYVAECAQNIVTKNNQHVVVKYKRGDFESSAPLLTFSLETTALAVSDDGQYLVAGSSDFNVKCLQLNNPEKGYDRYECEAPVVDVSVDPKGTFFSVSTTDGNVHFRTTEKSAAKKPIAQFKACTKFSYVARDSPRMHVVWKRDGERVFIPATGGVIVVDCAKWTQDRILKPLEIDHETFSTAAISPAGDLLASCTVQGTLVVWKMNELQCIHTRTIKISPSIVTSLVFNAFDEGSVVAAYTEGFLGLIKNLTKATKNSSKTSRVTSFSAHPSHDNLRSAEPIDGDDFAVVSRNKSPVKSNEVKLRRIDSDGDMSRKSDENNFVVFDDGDNDNGEDGSLVVTDEVRFGFNREGEFIGGGLAANPSKPNNYLPQATSVAQFLPRDSPPVPIDPCTTIKQMKMPKSFIPGSIPSQNNQRYLVWNTVGKIRSFKTSDDSTIEVTFHDASIHPEFNIDNTAENYVFGDLNASTVALASRSNSDRESKLYVRHISAWDDSREWFTRLANGEEVKFLSVGRDFVAIFTSCRFLRVFTAAGTQRSIISLPTPLISMCANGSSLVSVRPTGGVVILSEDEYEHQLIADIFEIQPFSTTAQIRHCRSIPICLGEESRLEWISFTNSNHLVTMDSGCTVRLYVDTWASWVPILIGAELLRDIDSDHIWPIAVLERPEPKFRYVYCRGSQFPSANKNLLPETANWKIPVLEAETDKSGFEHEMLVNELVQTILRESSKLSQKTANAEIARLTTEYTKNLIKLFAQNLNTGRECRAVELAHLTANAQGIQIMCNFSAKKERAFVSEKIATIGRNRIQAEEKAKAEALVAHALAPNNSTAVPVEPAEHTADTNRIAPNPVRLKRKLAEKSSQSSTNSVTAKRVAIETLNDSDIFDDDVRPLTEVTKTPMSALLNSTADGDLSQISVNFNTPNLNKGKNPFKRNEANVDNIYQNGIDFFDQLSKKCPQSGRSNSEKNNATKGKRQSKLSFGGLSTGSKENDESATLSQPKKRTGFEMWSEGNRSALLDEFAGDPADFQKFLVQKFRTLDAAEKARWNQSAKSQ